MARKANPAKDIIAKNLLRFREERNLSQQDAAMAADVPIDNLRRYEQGTSTPGPHVLRDLAVVYGHTMDDFLSEEPPPANLDAIPSFFLRTMPGVEIDAAARAKLQAAIDDVNAAKIKAKKKTKRP